MATLAVDKPRAQELGDRNDFPVIAADIIYEGAAVGLVAGTGHARPLVAGDQFVGFAVTKCDNSLGAAAEKLVKVLATGRVQVPVTGAVITNVGVAAYASDDDTFTTTVGANSFVGFIQRFISTGVAIVAFDALRLKA